MSDPLQQLAEELAADAPAGRWPPVRVGAAGALVVVDGRRVVNLGSTDYLGLAADRRLARAVGDVLDDGPGAGGTRRGAGNSRILAGAEEALADFLGVDAAWVTLSEMEAVAAAVAVLAGPGGHVVVDAAAASATRWGCRAGGAEVAGHGHRDPSSAAEALEAGAGARRVLVAEGLFPRTGDVAPLPELLELAVEHDATVLLHDAHGIGVLGEGGRGTASHHGVDPARVVHSGGLGHALGGSGGFVAGPAAVVDAVRRRDPGAAAAPPPLAAALVAALEALQGDVSVLERLWKAADRLRAGLRERGIVAGGETPVFPLPAGEGRAADDVARDLLERQVLVAVPPDPEGNGEILATVTAAHEPADLDRALEGISGVLLR